jgi:hypothetical protein
VGEEAEGWIFFGRRGMNRVASSFRVNGRIKDGTIYRQGSICALQLERIDQDGRTKAKKHNPTRA